MSKYANTLLIGILIGLFLVQLCILHLSLTNSTTSSFLELNEAIPDESKYQPRLDKCGYGPHGPRILCAVFANYNDLSKAQKISNTWGKKCFKLLIMTATDTKQQRQRNSNDINVINLNFVDTYTNLSMKTFKAVRYVYKNFLDDFDWFLKADDDTYIIMENLKYFLSSKCRDEKFTYGYNFFLKEENITYHSGGAGYVISNNGIDLLGKAIHSKKCRIKYGTEDVDLGLCNVKVGLKVGDSRDRFGNERFHCLSINEHWLNISPWLHTYAVNPVKGGPDCCSESSISFHYTVNIDIFDHILYKIRPMSNYRINLEDYFIK